MATVSQLRTTQEWEQELGERLRQVRLGKNLTQASMAKSANVSLGALKKLEAGTGSRLQTMIQVTRALDQVQWLESIHLPKELFSPLAVLREEKARAAIVRKRGRAAHTQTLLQS